MCHVHLHVGGVPLQNPLGSHILFLEPSSIWPSGQRYSIVDPIVVFELTIVVFSRFSGLPHVDGAVEQTRYNMLPKTECFEKTALTALTYPVKIVQITSNVIPKP